MLHRIIKSGLVAILSTALLAACGSSEDADKDVESAGGEKAITARSDEAKPTFETVSHQFLVDGGIWLPVKMQCGDATSNFWRFELDGTTGSYSGPANFGKYSIQGSELEGYKIRLSWEEDEWHGDAGSETLQIAREGSRLLIGGTPYHSCGKNEQVAEVAPPPSRAEETQVYFSCRTTSGKVARFSRVGNNLNYSYGRPGNAPDLTFAVPLKSAVFELARPAGLHVRFIEVKFNGTKYTGIHRIPYGMMNDVDEQESGNITVTRGDRTLADTDCADIPKSNFEGTDYTDLSYG